ncbi:hypothetical protein [Mycobacterium sp. IDR2000157661]|uniref:hypothetical protein n=1 Tax=Mycobacterium sp. IDR2000157661 TaxID=2867005 RepID=UPI001EE9B96B|nr:hypothetical protein [Mycobacterium sp. IDR2000157661]ULE33545.1 hypothetical protein K3G64_02185 [Mycobacterium sp. IDR2000157661]
MNRPYTASSPYSLTPTERIRIYPDETPAYDAGPGYGSGHGPDDYSDGYDSLHEFDDYSDFDQQRYDEERLDRHWMWIAGIAGVILFVAVGTTGVILGGGDSGSVAATVTSAAPTTSAGPATTSAAPSAATPAPAVPALPPETVTTVSPTAETTVHPTPAPTPAAAPPPAPSPRTITYRVTGNRQLIDLVTVIYTDQRGALQTDVNVALPWAKTVVLDPGVELKSVTATSVAGQLNCSITDAAGTLITAQNNNSMITTCTR